MNGIYPFGVYIMCGFAECKIMGTKKQYTVYCSC